VAAELATVMVELDGPGPLLETTTTMLLDGGSTMLLDGGSTMVLEGGSAMLLELPTITLLEGGSVMLALEGRADVLDEVGSALEEPGALLELPTMTLLDGGLEVAALEDSPAPPLLDELPAAGSTQTPSRHSWAPGHLPSPSPLPSPLQSTEPVQPVPMTDQKPTSAANNGKTRMLVLSRDWMFIG